MGSIPVQATKNYNTMKTSLKGVFSEFNQPTYIKKKLGKKIKGRKAIPDYSIVNKRTKQDLGENYTKDEYNRTYIKNLKKTLYTCKQFECGNISDSSDILILSVNENFDEYTLEGIFKK